MLSFSVLFAACAIQQKGIDLIPVAKGWANNSVNAVIFRKNSLSSYKDTQFVAFYNDQMQVVLGKRNLKDTKWQLKTTSFVGNTSDAHCAISIIVDGEGYLHLSWNHHNNKLHYSQSVAPGSLIMSAEMPMIGNKESRVSYPEFYRMPNGDLFFLYRDGGSGNGDLVLNRYHLQEKKWERIQSNLIDGEGQRNAYCQAAVDEKGVIHISWVWRETPDVASNHDLCYAKSTDGGKTWEKSNGEKYQLPINAATAEYAIKIPQKSELINQTSMTTDEDGNPYIATYWSEIGTHSPQYRVVYRHDNEWKTTQASNRTQGFSLSGGGTKKIPISRPQIMINAVNKKIAAYIIFRDEARGNKVSALVCEDMNHPKWKVLDLSKGNVGQWEPSFDTNLWQTNKTLNLFVQKVAQGDAETSEMMPPQEIKVLVWKPKQ
jgi:hypothetical protein